MCPLNQILQVLWAYISDFNNKQKYSMLKRSIRRTYNLFVKNIQH